MQVDVRIERFYRGVSEQWLIPSSVRQVRAEEFKGLFMIHPPLDER